MEGPSILAGDGTCSSTRGGTGTRPATGGLRRLRRSGRTLCEADRPPALRRGTRALGHGGQEPFRDLEGRLRMIYHGWAGALIGIPNPPPGLRGQLDSSGSTPRIARVRMGSDPDGGGDAVSRQGTRVPQPGGCPGPTAVGGDQLDEIVASPALRGVAGPPDRRRAARVVVERARRTVPRPSAGCGRKPHPRRARPPTSSGSSTW